MIKPECIAIPQTDIRTKNAKCSFISGLGISGQLILGLSSALGHLLVARVLQLLGLVVMRRNLQQPLALDLNHVPHELLRCEDQLEVDDPPREFFEHAAVRMDSYTLKKNCDALVSEGALRQGGRGFVPSTNISLLI